MDAYGVPRSPGSSFDEDEAIQDDYEMQELERQQQLIPNDYDQPEPEPFGDEYEYDGETINEHVALGEVTVANDEGARTLRQPSDDFGGPWQHNLRQNRQRHASRDNSRQSDSTLDTDGAGDGLETSPAPPSRKRKTRAQLEKTPDWMPAFIPAIMTALGESGSALSDRDIKDVIHKVLDSMPGEGQQQPSIDDVMRELTKSRDGVPSCIDACHTVHKIVGKLVRDPISRPFKDGTDARTKAECDNLRLEAAWRVVGHGMDERFAVAQTRFQNSIFNRASGELPFQLGLLAQATPNSLTPPSKHAIISLPSFMTPVCAGLHNVGDCSASPISTTFDLIRCCGGLDKHPNDEKPFWFKLESGAESEFNDGSAALVLANVANMMKSTCSINDFPQVKSVFELMGQDRASDEATLRYELFAHWPTMRLKDTLNAAAEMLDFQEATCVSGRDRGGKYGIDGSLYFRGRDYERDLNSNRVLLSSSLLVRVSKAESRVADLFFKYRDSKPVMDVHLWQADAMGKISVVMDRPDDAAAFRKLVCFHEYPHSDLEAARREYASPACPNNMLMYYTAALILNDPPSLPEFGKVYTAPMEGEDDEMDANGENRKWSHRTDPEVLASMAASIMGDKIKFCYLPQKADGSSKPTPQWWEWTRKDLWTPTTEPKVFEGAMKALEDIAGLVEKKLSDIVGFSDIEYHFESMFRCNMQPWKTNVADASQQTRRDDVLFHVRKHADGLVKRLKASRDPLSKELMLALSRICYEDNFVNSIDAPGTDLLPCKNGVQELSPPFGFCPATPSMRISSSVGIELPAAGSVSDAEFEGFLQFVDDEFFGHREVTLRELDKVAEGMTGTPGGCPEGGLNLWLGPFYAGTVIAASRCGKGRFTAFVKTLLSDRATKPLAHSLLQQGPVEGKPCEEMKPLVRAHVGFFDEFNSNDGIGEAVKAKHAYISPNFIKQIVPSSTERLMMPFHGKFGLLSETSGNLVRLVVLANGVPVTNVKDPSILNRLEVTPFHHYGFVTQEDLDKAIKDGEVPEAHRDRCFVVDKGRILGDSKYHAVALRYLVDRIISIRGGNAGGQTPRPQDKDCKSWHPPSKYHDEHKRRYIDAVSKASEPKIEYTHDQACNSIKHAVGLRVVQCKGCVSSEPIKFTGMELRSKLNRFQTASKGKENCFCGKKNAADACHFEFKDFMDQLRVMAPKAWEHFNTNAGRVHALQSALGIEERVIPQKKIAGHGRNNVIFGFRLKSTGLDNVDGTAFGKIEGDMIGGDQVAGEESEEDYVYSSDDE